MENENMDYTVQELFQEAMADESWEEDPQMREMIVTMFMYMGA